MRKGERLARESLTAGGLCRDTNGRIVTGGQLGRWVVSRDSLRYGRGHGHDTTDYARDTVGEAETRRTATQEEGGGATTRPGVHCNSTGSALRHGRARPTTWRSVHEGWAKGGCTVHLTQCTVFSHCLGHCSRGFKK